MPSTETMEQKQKASEQSGEPLVTAKGVEGEVEEDIIMCLHAEHPFKPGERKIIPTRQPGEAGNEGGAAAGTTDAHAVVAPTSASTDPDVGADADDDPTAAGADDGAADRYVSCVVPGFDHM